MNYEKLFELWFPASIIIGLCSIPAGRLADKWSSPGMLIIMFLGMGISSFLASIVNEQYTLMLFLGSLGLFAAIYHPVGIPWMIKTSESKPGIRLAINGLFGGCLLYTSDAADEEDSVDLGGRRIIKKK